MTLLFAGNVAFDHGVAFCADCQQHPQWYYSKWPRAEWNDEAARLSHMLIAQIHGRHRQWSRGIFFFTPLNDPGKNVPLLIAEGNIYWIACD